MTENSLVNKEIKIKGRPSSERKCDIDGCEKPHYGLGFCNAHYQKSRRHGCPEYIGKAPDGAGRKFIDENVKYTGMECLLFPYKSHSGYGRITLDGKRMGAHIAMCLLAHGPKPSENHQALHLPVFCRSALCVNPNHLRWGTIADNKIDLAIHTVSLMGTEKIRELLRWTEASEGLL